MLYPCLCCGNLTRDEPSNGDYIICPVSFWEDDPVQAEDHDWCGGANVPSLNQARENFKKYGVMEERFVIENLLKIKCNANIHYFYRNFLSNSSSRLSSIKFFYNKMS